MAPKPRATAPVSHPDIDKLMAEALNPPHPSDTIPAGPPPMVVRATPHVLSAYHAIMRALCEQGLAKSSRNQQQGFNFRGIDQVYAVLTPELVRHGCILIPSIEKVENWTGQTSKGNTMFYTRATVKFSLTSIEDGSTLSWSYVGEGADQGDKSTSKSLSMAYKYMAIHAFGIPVTPQSTDDADSDTPDPVVQDTAPSGSSEPGVDLESLKSIITSSPSIEDLQANFTSAMRAARNRNKADWEPALVTAKDTRKQQLTTAKE